MSATFFKTCAQPLTSCGWPGTGPSNALAIRQPMTPFGIRPTVLMFHPPLAGSGANSEAEWDTLVIWMKWAEGEQGERHEGSVCRATFRPGCHHPVCALVGADRKSVVKGK